MPQFEQSYSRPDSPEKSTTSAAAEPGENAPYWLPRGDAWRRLSEPIRRAVHQSILPMWKQLVDRAADELERSTAATLVYLTWLEVRGQIELEEARGDSDPLSTTLADPDRWMAQHLQLLKAKHRTSELLARLRSAREKSAGRQAAAAAEPRSPFFGIPLGTVRKSRESSLDSREPDDAQGQDRLTQRLPGEKGDSRGHFDQERGKMDPPDVLSRSEQGVAGRQTWRTDGRSGPPEAQQDTPGRNRGGSS